MPFYFFFGILGLVIGGLVAWFFMADHPFETPETPGGPVDALEAAFLASQMAAEGTDIDETAVARLLELHGAYVTGYTRDSEFSEAAGAEALSDAGPEAF